MTTRLCAPPTIKGPTGEIIKQNAAGQLCITCEDLEAWLEFCKLQDTFYVIEGPDADGIVTATYTDADGNTTSTQWETDDDGTVVDNGDGTYSYLDSDGTVIETWPAGGTVVDNGDGSLSFIVAGVVQETWWDGCASSLVMTGPGEWTYTPADGSAPTVITDQQFDEMLVDNGDNTYTWTDHNGNTFTFGAGVTTIADNADGTATVTNPDGTTCIVSVEKVETICENGYIVQRTTNLKTGAVTEVQFGPSVNRASQYSNPGTIVDDSFAPGDVAATYQLTIYLPCPVRDLPMNYVAQVDTRMLEEIVGASDQVSLGMWASVNGGTFAGFGFNDYIETDADDQNNQGNTDSPFNGQIGMPWNLPTGIHVIDFEYRVGSATNIGPNSSVRVNQSRVSIDIAEMVHH